MTTTLAFAVRRKEPVVVRPAVATPRETKRLSYIDEQVFLRKHVPIVFFYRRGCGHDRRDPVAVIRSALGQALVPYYPLAGRLREVEGGELVVDCTGEGVMFVEADADVRLAELEAAGLRPPFPYTDQLLVDFEQGSGSRPFLLFQVTRLLCGGFVVAFRFCHTICDGTGIAQFIFAVAELARGLPSPTVSPAWSRDLLRSPRKKPPAAPECDATTAPPSGGGDKVTRTFTLGPPDIANIKRMCLLPPDEEGEPATTFEAVMAALWRARTAALALPPDEEVSLLAYHNVRRVRGLDLPAGYYGNAVVVSAAVTTAGELLARPLGHAVAKLREAKAAVTAELVRSTTDPLMLRRWTDLGTPNAFRVSDLRYVINFQRMDFGWGQPACGGRPDMPYEVTILHAVNDGGVAVPIVLPRAAMDRFAAEVKMLLAPLPLVPASSPAHKPRL